MPQRLTGDSITVFIQVGVPLPQQLLGPGVAANLLALVPVTDHSCGARTRFSTRRGGGNCLQRLWIHGANPMASGYLPELTRSHGAAAGPQLRRLGNACDETRPAP